MCDALPARPAIGLLSVLLLSASVQAAPITVTVTGTNWFPGPGAPTYTLDARVAFDNGNPPAWQATQGAINFKGQGASPATINTSTKSTTVFGVGTASGRGTSTRSYVLAGVIDQNFTATISYDVVLASTGPFVQAQAWIANPYTYLVGAAGTSQTYAYSLAAGTSFQDSAAQPGTANVTLYSRMGLGAGFDASVPSTLWGSSSDGTPGAAPSGALDIFKIALMPNAANDHLAAVVSGAVPSGLTGFSVASSRDAGQIASALNAAPWTHNGGQWVLDANLPLFTLTFTNQSSLNQGQILAVGQFGNVAAAVPEPAAPLLFGVGGLWMAGMLRRRHYEPACRSKCSLSCQTPPSSKLRLDCPNCAKPLRSSTRMDPSLPTRALASSRFRPSSPKALSSSSRTASLA
jgi:hypothetical protein